MTHTDTCTGAQLAEEVMFKRSQVAALNDILAKVNSMQKTVRANFLISFFLYWPDTTEVPCGGAVAVNGGPGGLRKCIKAC